MGSGIANAPDATRIWAEVDLNAIRANLRGIRSRVGPRVRIMAVVKANAYGHGAVPVALAAEGCEADYLGVAFPEEGAELRTGGARAPIHVFTLSSDHQIPLYARHHLEPTVCSVRESEALNRFAQRNKTKFQVHLKIDTGMNRIGVRLDQLEQFLKDLAGMRRLEVKGVFTHLATADEVDKTFARLQLARFETALSVLRRHGVTPEVVHCANSAAILDLPEAWYSMVRPGIMMYGYYPSAHTSESIRIKPAMTLKTKAVLVKRVGRGESVSYGRRFIAERETGIVTLPVGYADGVSRRLTGLGCAIVNGRRAPFAGTVCMDQVMLDVGRLRVSPGDEVVLIGRQGKQTISAWEIATSLGTIPYEVCCAVSARVPRIYKGL